MQYDKKWDRINREKTFITDARDEGIAIGMEKGKAIGRKEGETIGSEKARIEMARNAKKMGMSTDNIIAFTGLSREEVERL